MNVSDVSLIEKVSELAGDEIYRCYQCQKCSSGCPIASEMDILPAAIIRLIHLGQKDAVLSSRTIWICASCETCTTRCPNEIDIAMIMDTMREACLESGQKPKVMDVVHFHRSFLSSIKKHGRVHELEMIGKFKMKTKKFMDDMQLGMDMFKKGKIKLFPHNIKGKKEIKKIFKDHAKNS